MICLSGLEEADQFLSVVIEAEDPRNSSFNYERRASKKAERMLAELSLR